MIEALSREFPVKGLCRLCGVGRSGCCKWRGRDEAPPEERARILRPVQERHDAHPSRGYRRVHAFLARGEGVAVSADYIRRCFRYLGIRARRSIGRDGRRGRRAKPTRTSSSPHGTRPAARAR